MKTKEELAIDILEYSRNRLLVKMPFLNRALFSLKLEVSDGMNFGSDGLNIFFKSNYIIAEYKENNDYFIRGLMHMLLHLLFRHNIVDEKIDYQLWNLASDIAVENTMLNLGLELKNDNEKKCKEIIDSLRNSISSFNVETIYRYYKSNGLNSEEIDTLRYYFFYDEHGLWYRGTKEIKEAKNWEDISRQIETDLETFHEGDAGYLSQQLNEINRHKMTLKYFLKRFGRQEEEMKVSLENIDMQLYTYGLSVYDNLALVENEEYREERKIKDLVIAIDTSGSVKGELVRKFVEYAYSLLSDESLLSKDMNLYLLECDDRIQNVTVIRNKDDMDEYLEHHELKGFGETDFRPVFEYTNELIAEGKIKDLKGLIYFTDGKGIFPKSKMKYPTAFVIYQKSYEYIDVPGWAMKIELMEDDILDELFD